MDANESIAAIRRRRDNLFDAQGVGTANDSLQYSAAEVVRAIADEYDSLLAEVESGEPT